MSIYSSAQAPYIPEDSLVKVTQIDADAKVYGSLMLRQSGSGFAVAEGGTISRQGVVQLAVGGSATVPNSSVTSVTRIFLTIQDVGTNPAGSSRGNVWVASRTAGSSFVIQSTFSGDATCDVAWEMFEPANSGLGGGFPNP